MQPFHAAVNLGSISIASAKLTSVTPMREVQLPSPAAAAAAAPAAPAGTPAAVSAAKLRVDSVRLLDPVLSQAISKLAPPAPGVPREQIKTPISPTADVSDLLLFEAAANPAEKFYIPKYGLATQRISGQEQYQVKMAPSGDGWALTLRLNKSANPKLGVAARDAKELPHQVNLLLRYTVPNSASLQKELLFTEVAEEGALLRGTLRVSSIAERDELFHVLTDRATPASLVARRTMEVAIPVTAPPAPVRGSAGTGTLRGTWSFDFNAGAEATAGDVWWEQMTKTARRLKPKGQAQLALLGAVDFDSLSLDALKKQTYTTNPIDGSLPTPVASPPILRTPVGKLPASVFAGARASVLIRADTIRADIPIRTVSRNNLSPGTVFAVKTNTGSYSKVKVLEYGYNLKLQWQTFPATAPQPQLFRETTRTLDDIVPLQFDRDLHGYIFAELTGMGKETSQPGLRRWPVRWNGRDHSYYQESARPYVFYYLADAFKLARRPQAPHVPLLAFQLETDADSDSPTVRFDFTGFKDEDEARLANAAAVLKPQVPPGNPAPVLLPINVSQATFELAMPRGGAGGPFQQRTGAAVSSSLGLVDSLSAMPLDDFTAIWDAMADPTGNAVLFQGRVTFHLAGEAAEQIPFVARLSDMVGEVLDVVYEVKTEAAPGSLEKLKATVNNAIESPVTVNAIQVRLMRGEASVAGRVDAVRNASGAAVTLPVTLASGEALEVDISAVAALPGAGELDADFDFPGLAVQPDLSAILGPIAQGLKPESSRKVEVSTFKEVLANAGLSEIKVMFDTGSPVTLSTSTLDGSTKVRYKVLDLLARKPETLEYTYRIVTPSGARPPRTASGPSLIVTSDLL